MEEKYIDALLNIDTSERKAFSRSIHYHRYEATPYEGLEKLFRNYEIMEGERIVDFGCGKGRLCFFANYTFRAHAAGVEMDERLYREAVANLTRYERRRKGGENISFYHCLAEEYDIAPQDRIFYFFNPFSIHVFRKVVNRILLVAEQGEGKRDLILYYPSKDYIYYLEKDSPFTLFSEIPIDHRIEKDDRERFLIYRIDR